MRIAVICLLPQYAVDVLNIGIIVNVNPNGTIGDYMIVIKNEIYKKLLKNMNLSIESQEKCIDIYHKNNWDGFVMYYDEECKNEAPSYVDFFFNAKVKQ